MDDSIKFLFYLAAVICFALAAVGPGLRLGRRGGVGVAQRVALEPLGLFFFAFPSMWDTGVAAF